MSVPIVDLYKYHVTLNKPMSLLSTYLPGLRIVYNALYFTSLEINLQEDGKDIKETIFTCLPDFMSWTNKQEKIISKKIISVGHMEKGLNKRLS